MSFFNFLDQPFWSESLHLLIESLGDKLFGNDVTHNDLLITLLFALIAFLTKDIVGYLKKDKPKSRSPAIDTRLAVMEWRIQEVGVHLQKLDDRIEKLTEKLMEDHHAD
jgi:hypothetical protein